MIFVVIYDNISKLCIIYLPDVDRKYKDYVYGRC